MVEAVAPDAYRSRSPPAYTVVLRRGGRSGMLYISCDAPCCPSSNSWCSMKVAFGFGGALALNGCGPSSNESTPSQSTLVGDTIDGHWLTVLPKKCDTTIMYCWRLGECGSGCAFVSSSE